MIYRKSQPNVCALVYVLGIGLSAGNCRIVEGPMGTPAYIKTLTNSSCTNK